MIIVAYHGLSSPRSPVTVPPSRLDRDLAALAAAGFAFVTMDQCTEWLAARIDLPARTAVLTFDDGYASVARDGLPILRRHRAPATVYVVAGRIGSDNAWPGQHPRVAAMPLLDAGEITRLVDAGVTIGSHSVSHRALDSLADAACREEVDGSAAALEAISGGPIRHFSYPYGRHSASVTNTVRKRYDSAVTASCGPLRPGTDPYLIPRIDAHDLSVAIDLQLLTSPLLDRYFAIRSIARRCRRLVERASRRGGWEGVR